MYSLPSQRLAMYPLVITYRFTKRTGENLYKKYLSMKYGIDPVLISILLKEAVRAGDMMLMRVAR